jgi:hypothetical protein
MRHAVDWVHPAFRNGLDAVERERSQSIIDASTAVSSR